MPTDRPPLPSRRRLLQAGAAALVAAGLGARAQPAPSFKETPWDDLMPKGWDPMKGLDLSRLPALNDTDPAARKLMQQLREAWDQAPVVPALEGRAIRIAGYVVPLEESAGELREFLLVPYFGACIHTPPPPANQVIHVLPDKPLKGIRSMMPVWASGLLKVQRGDSDMGVSGYRMAAQRVVPYESRR